MTLSDSQGNEYTKATGHASQRGGRLLTLENVLPSSPRGGRLLQQRDLLWTPQRPQARFPGLEGSDARFFPGKDISPSGSKNSEE